MSTILTSHSPYVAVTCSPQPYVGTCSPGAGMVRYNNGILEAFDGYSWINISTYVDVSLLPPATTAIVWAQEKMAEEARLQALMDKYPALKTAKDNYELIKTLVLSENPSDNESI